MGKKKVAFALGGLAGNNAHGAGFLQAAMEKKVEPVIVSCSSGQIFWVYKYLTVKGNTEDLREILEEEIKKSSPTNNPDLNRLNLALFGRADIFRPAFLEFAKELSGNVMEACQKMMLNFWGTSLMETLSRTIPDRTLVPMFPDVFFSNISDAFNSADIGIVFNSYNPIDGIEYIYLNDSAQKLLGAEFDKKDSYRDHAEYRRITPKSVKEALWLYQYGFDEDHITFDGAYYRQIMLSELVPADKIYVARPVSFHWIGALPKSYVGVEDLKTETSFNGTYVGERDKIQLINRLVRDGVFKDEVMTKKKYHAIDLIEIEIDTQEGFFDYINEKMSVFDRAREKSLSCLSA